MISFTASSNENATQIASEFGSLAKANPDVIFKSCDVDAVVEVKQDPGVSDAP